MTERALPFAGQFSPGQVDLLRLLEIARVHSGDRDAMQEEICATFFARHAPGQQMKLAGNTVLALREYRILSTDFQLSDLGRALLALPSESDLYRRFSTHILLNLHGLDLVRTVQAMQQAGETVTLESLSRELRVRGIGMPWGGMHISGMKGWLQKAGVVRPGRGWSIDQDILTELVGAEEETLEGLEMLSADQRAFLRGLANLGLDSPVSWRRVAEYAERLYGVTYPEKSFPKNVLWPLEQVGLIRAMKTTAGRGAKPYLVQMTDKLRREHVEPLLASLTRSTALPPKGFIRPLWEILDELGAPDRGVKGKALEFLAARLCRLLDLRFVAWRLRSAQTGGAEVDAILDGARLIYSRWQVQCKNTPLIALDDVAKEVGLAFHLRSNVVVVVGNGKISRAAREFSDSMMRSSNLNIVLMDQQDLRRVAAEPTAVVQVFDREAAHAMDVKRIEV